MPLHYTLASEPPASRRLRRSAPLLLLLGILAGAPAPGLIAGDRPFQTSLCDDLEHAPAACAPLERTLSAVLRARGADLGQSDEPNGAGALSTGVVSVAVEDRQLPLGSLRELGRLFRAEDQLATVPPGRIAE
jgi:hypothetical protein